MKRIAFLVICLAFDVAQARVFDFNKRIFSAYVRGSYGFNRLQRSAYEPGLPANTDYGNAPVVTQQFSGEFGFGAVLGNTFNFRVGMEALNPMSVKGAVATNAAGTQIFGFDSEAYSIIPQANIEVFFRKRNQARLYVGGGVGMAYTTIKNTIRPTAAGQGVLRTSDYIEEGTATNLMYQGFMGLEFAFVDNLSLSFDLGYRVLRASGFKSGRDSTTYLGAIAKGDTLKNRDGSERSADLSGLFAGLTLRFYIY